MYETVHLGGVVVVALCEHTEPVEINQARAGPAQWGCQC